LRGSFIADDRARYAYTYRDSFMRDFAAAAWALQMNDVHRHVLFGTSAVWNESMHRVETTIDAHRA
jgi:hypothetical protein